MASHDVFYRGSKGDFVLPSFMGDNKVCPHQSFLACCDRVLSCPLNPGSATTLEGHCELCRADWEIDMSVRYRAFDPRDGEFRPYPFMNLRVVYCLGDACSPFGEIVDCEGTIRMSRWPLPRSQEQDQEQGRLFRTELESKPQEDAVVRNWHNEPYSEEE